MRKDKWQEALIAALIEASQGKVHPRTCFQCGQADHFRRVSPEKATSGTLPHLPGKTLEGTLSSVPRGTKARASNAMMGPWASHPGSVITIKAEELRVKHKVSPLIDTGASISIIPFSPGPRSSKKITVWGITPQPVGYLSKEFIR
jgi:hypothetical protein